METVIFFQRKLHFLTGSCESLFIFHNHRVYALLRVENIRKVVVKDAGRDAVVGDKCKVPSYTKAYPMIETMLPASRHGTA